jgi:hypothetical protein
MHAIALIKRACRVRYCSVHKLGEHPLQMSKVLAMMPSPSFLTRAKDKEASYCALFKLQ